MKLNYNYVKVGKCTQLQAIQQYGLSGDRGKKLVVVIAFFRTIVESSGP